MRKIAKLITFLKIEKERGSMTTNIVTDSKKKFDFFLMNWTKTSSLAQVSILVSRCLFSLIFIMASFSHFSNQTLNYATSAGVPFASLLVPLSGVMVLLAGLSIMLGYQARFGAILIILFLVPSANSANHVHEKSLHSWWCNFHF